MLVLLLGRAALSMGAETRVSPLLRAIDAPLAAGDENTLNCRSDWRIWKIGDLKFGDSTRSVSDFSRGKSPQTN